MKTLYLECNMGVAGDMLFAALLELHPDPEDFLGRMNALAIPGVSIKAVPSVKCGITGTHVEVTVNGEEENSQDMPLTGRSGAVSTHSHSHDHTHADREDCAQREADEEEEGHHPHDHHHHEHHHEHHHHEHHHHHDPHDHHHHHDSHQEHTHRGLSQIRELINRLELPERVKNDAVKVYESIAAAESAVHHRKVEEVHFHEVGSMDAVADVVGVCLLLYELAPEKITASAVNTGFGQVRCAHGILPVPAPATACLLENIPVYSGRIEGELCTPTGAALLKYFVSEFNGMTPMRIVKTGYGMGKKDFEAANCVRAILGEAQAPRDVITELACNLDDMTPEEIGFATELLLERGALDVYTTSVYMKKNRPGVMLTCLCRQEQTQEMLELIFKHTTTLGVREYVCNRYCMSRTIEKRQTPFGEISVKKADGYGAVREKAEYEELARIARKQDLSLRQVKEETGRS